MPKAASQARTMAQTTIHVNSGNSTMTSHFTTTTTTTNREAVRGGVNLHIYLLFSTEYSFSKRFQRSQISGALKFRDSE